MSNEIDKGKPDRFKPLGKEQVIDQGIKDLYGEFNNTRFNSFNTPAELVSGFVNECSEKRINHPQSGVDKLLILRDLNAVVLDDAMRKTYEKILNKGMPWTGGEYGRENMVGHISKIVDREAEKHLEASFISQVIAERRLLVDLKRIGDTRLSDSAGDYSSFLGDAGKKGESDSSSERSVLLQGTMMLSPWLRVFNSFTQMFESKEVKERHERLTSEYEAIRLSADRWLEGIHDIATHIPEAHMSHSHKLPH